MCLEWKKMGVSACIYNGFEANLVLDDSRFDQGLQVPQWWDNIQAIEEVVFIFNS